MPGTHAVLSPSSMARIIACPPSARLNEKLNEIVSDRSSPFAEEGTKAHALAELKLRNFIGEINDFNYGEQRKQLGSIPDEMDKATDYYTSIIQEKYYAAKRNDESTTLVVEQKLDMSDWAPKCFGTGDCVIITEGLVEVIDLKYGKGIPVSAVNNPQARMYGLGAIKMFDGIFSVEKVRNTIIQPRLDSVSEETLTVEELKKWAEEVVKPAAALAWEGKGEFQAGDHCQFCAAKAICAARARDAMKVFDAGLNSPDLIDANIIPDLLTYAPLAKKWIADLENYALSEALRGASIKGWKLVRGRRPNKTWTKEEDVETNLLRAGYTDDVIFNKKIATPSALEKAIGKKAFQALVGQFVVQGDGKLELAPETDERIEYTSAEAAFNDL